MLGKGKIFEADETTSRAMALFFLPKATPKAGLFASEDSKQDIFTGLLKHLESWLRQGKVQRVVNRRPDSEVDFLIKNYGLVVVMFDNAGRKICYSNNYRNKLPVEFTERLRTFFLGIQPDDIILWADSVFNEGQEAPAREVIWGERATKMPRQTRQQVKKKWAQPQGLSPDELHYLMGKGEEPPEPPKP